MAVAKKKKIWGVFFWRGGLFFGGGLAFAFQFFFFFVRMSASTNFVVVVLLLFPLFVENLPTSDQLNAFYDATNGSGWPVFAAANWVSVPLCCATFSFSHFQSYYH